VATLVKLEIVESNLFDIAPKSDLDWFILLIAPSITVIAFCAAVAVPKDIAETADKPTVGAAAAKNPLVAVALLPVTEKVL